MRPFVAGSTASGALHSGQRFAKPGLSGFSSNSSAHTMQTFVGNVIEANRNRSGPVPPGATFSRNAMAMEDQRGSPRNAPRLTPDRRAVKLAGRNWGARIQHVPLEHRAGIEPANTGFADQRVNHFATGARAEPIV